MNHSPVPATVTDRIRPTFPKRAVITAGMPYGNKNLHFGHIGGVFIQADVFARFLRDRIGRENVIFVSGTDCYGSPIAEAHRQALESGTFAGPLGEFVRENHERQKATLAEYDVRPDLFAASGLSPYREIHEELGKEILESLYANGHLLKLSTPQFYDLEREVFLNGRQVEGQCPIEGCGAEKAYADECSLGHQYEPKDLLNPRSVLTGHRPEMRNVTNWYVDVSAFRLLLEEWLGRVRENGTWRPFAVSSLAEHFEPPTIHITRDQIEALDAIAPELPPHTRQPGRKKSLQLVFETVEDMETAVSVLGSAGIRYRTGKTLVPFRLTGNLEWGLKAPCLEELADLTFWVWPESLWAPVSFTAAYLEQRGEPRETWRHWWCSREAGVYQFIGEDNVFFYGLPQAAIFLGMQGTEPLSDPPESELQLTHLVANRHLLFLDRKGSSSGAVKPPMADELLEMYAPEQLRAHFFSMALGRRGVNFRPKPLNPKATEKEPDPVLKEGNVLTKSLNRAVRSCFYIAQQYADARVPVGEASADVVSTCETAILDFEKAMATHEFSQAFIVVDNLIRDINKRWSESKPYAADCDDTLRRQALVDAFHMVRVAAVLMHPIAPAGTEMIREYLRVGEDFWSWERIFDSVYAFMDDPETHALKTLEPRIDFFPMHPSQFGEGNKGN